MSDFPAANYLSDSARTEGEMKTAFENFLAACKQLLGAQASSDYTIASGAITPTGSIIRVDTEGGASTDNLDNINQTNLPDGSMVLVSLNNASRVVTLRHAQGGVGQLTLMNGNFVLNSTTKSILLRRSGTAWVELMRNFASDATSALAYYGAAADADLDAHVADVANPHAVTPTQLGLSVHEIILFTASGTFGTEIAAEEGDVDVFIFAAGGGGGGGGGAGSGDGGDGGDGGDTKFGNFGDSYYLIAGGGNGGKGGTTTEGGRGGAGGHLSDSSNVRVSGHDGRLGTENGRGGAGYGNYGAGGRGGNGGSSKGAGGGGSSGVIHFFKKVVIPTGPKPLIPITIGSGGSAGSAGSGGGSAGVAGLTGFMAVIW